MRDSRRRRKVVSWVAASVLVPVFLSIVGSAAAAENEVYASRCAACHGAQGAGRGSIPALADNPIVNDETKVAGIIRSGQGGMPAFGDLTEAQVAELASYLRTTWGTSADGGAGEGSGPPPTAEADPLPPGDATRGEALFTGAAGLAEGGGPCAACHRAGTNGRLAGSRMLGTDLTELAARAGGAAGIAAMLEAPAFPVMLAAYDGRPLTEQERADLGAYFESLATAGPPSDTALGGRLWIIGAAGAAALFALMGLLWPRHRVTAAERLRGGSR